MSISYAVFCLKKKKKNTDLPTIHVLHSCVCIFFIPDTATTEIYTLSLHDALPICNGVVARHQAGPGGAVPRPPTRPRPRGPCRRRDRTLVPRLDLRRVRQRGLRSEEHTSELQSHVNLVCRLLLEKKKKKY